MSVEVIATGQWYFKDVATSENPSGWVPQNFGEPEQLRASLADKILTVWLPSGAKIRCRRARFDTDPMTKKYYHYYGFMIRQKIVFSLQPLTS